MAVINRAPLFTLLLLCCVYSLCGHSAVLDDDRLDILYQSYDGGGTSVKAPAIFVRKKLAESSAISAHVLTDMVSGASIDVEVSGASAYKEQRNEWGLGAEFLKGKAVYSLNLSQSSENDYDTQSVSASISQDFFGDLSTLSMAVSYSDSTVGKTGEVDFSENAKQYSLDVSWSQVLTKNWIASFSLNKALDQGYLQNPYRFTRYLNPESESGSTLQYIGDKDDELAYGFPDIRNSEAVAIKMRYLVLKNHVIYGGMRYFQDSFKIKAYNVDIGYNFRYQQRWLFDINFRHYEQTAAEFYRDLYDYQNQTNFRTRDKELSTFNDNMLSLSASYDLPHTAHWIKKSSVHAFIDHIVFDYDDFRDASVEGYTAGNEPLYHFSATLIRIMYSLWF
ncbi:MAG: DUF3570 domain-containing protein [Pseudomonadales bacterium]|nr:DUF3570 domain-containing protein [Pseudomonadales bacterium]